MQTTYWDRRMETMERPVLEAMQLEKLRRTLAAALQTPFYRQRLNQAGLSDPAALRGLDDVRRIPFTTKDDLREAFPRGLLSVPMERVVRLHTSSGTTGTPTVIYHTAEDIDHWTGLIARCIVAAGAGPADVFQNMMGYGLFTGGLGLHYGAERVGMAVIPSSAGNTSRQLRLMRDFHTTVMHATPSYMLHLRNQLEEEDISREDLSLRKGFTGAEAYTLNTSKKIEELFGIDVYNSYGLSEMNGPGVAFECVRKDDMHIWEDAYLVEVVALDGDTTRGEDQEGELVLTTLDRQATPLLRYRTGDITSLRPDPCPCGRTHRRLRRIRGRADDMLIVNGVNIYPQQIEAVLMKMPEVGTNYQIVLDKKGSLDRLTVHTEISSSVFSGDLKGLEELKQRMGQKLHAAVLIHPRVQFHEHGGLPVTEGKAKRVFDKRPLE